MVRTLLLLVLCAGAWGSWAESEMRPVLMGVALNVADIERSEKYYSEIFNLRRTFQYSPSGGPVIEIGLGNKDGKRANNKDCLLYTSPSPRDRG